MTVNYSRNEFYNIGPRGLQNQLKPKKWKFTFFQDKPDSIPDGDDTDHSTAHQKQKADEKTTTGK